MTALNRRLFLATGLAAIASPAFGGGSMPVGLITGHGMDRPDKPSDDSKREKTM